uniref:RNB domain-containing protein n=1 Tax=Angiostrongylus cantonensis TaxID=6313 RepID=A0A158P8R5_ANGCA
MDNQTNEESDERDKFIHSQECELRPPPCDFRTMSDEPVRADIFTCEVPYLRPAIVSGQYDNAAHYLDVQFRLLREDLVRPLRTGISMYKFSGTARKNMSKPECEPVVSDLFVFELESVYGLEVRGTDGLPIRFAKLTHRSTSDLALSDERLRIGQFVCLSSDGFYEDVHFAKIVYNNRSDDGMIGISILDEEDTIKKRCPYLLAEANSYLEAYKHVLSVMKNNYMNFRSLTQTGNEKCTNGNSSGNLRGLGRTIVREKLDVANTPRDFFLSVRERVVIDGINYELDKFQQDYKPLTLNDDQRNAISHALTRKTRVGVEIVRKMLQNRCRYGITEPILVTALTNNELDNFAEKLLSAVYSDTENSLIKHDGPLFARLGGGSRSDILKRRLISYDIFVINGLIPAHLQRQFSLLRETNYDSNGEPLDHDEMIACWLLDKTHRDGLTSAVDENDGEEGNSVEHPAQHFVPRNEPATIGELWDDAERFAWECEKGGDEIYLTEQKWSITEGSCYEDIVLLGSGYKRLHGCSSRFSGKMRNDEELVYEFAKTKDTIFRVEAMSADDARNVRSVLSLPKQRRWELYKLWTEQLVEQVRTYLPSYMKEYRAVCEETMEALTEQTAEVLSRCMVIFATTNGVAKKRGLLEKLRCRIIIVEEASKRLVRNGFPYSMLSVQYRMNVDITRNIIRPYFYSNIVDGKSVQNYPDVPGMDKRCFFWMHEGRETYITKIFSLENQTEVDMTLGLVSYLKKQGIDLKEMTIIAMYSAQVTKIQKAVSKQFGSSFDGRPLLAVQSVDSFQGKENRIVIVSLVGSMPNSSRLLPVENWITVSLSRAHHGVYVIGNFSHLSQGSPLWSRIVEGMSQDGLASFALTIRCKCHGNTQMITQPCEFLEKSPEGGCMESCNTKLQCGHICPRRCHPIDDHATWKCEQPCLRKCQDERYGHPCSRMCWEDCGKCVRMVVVSLGCGHMSSDVHCYLSATAVCSQRYVIGQSKARQRHQLNAVDDTGELFHRTCDNGGVGGLGVLVNSAFAVLNIGLAEQLKIRIGLVSSISIVGTDVRRHAESHVSLLVWRRRNQLQNVLWYWVVTLSSNEWSTTLAAQFAVMSWRRPGRKAKNRTRVRWTSENACKCHDENGKVVERVLECGHLIRVACFERDSPKQCEMEVFRNMERCGHSVYVPCHAANNPVYCPAICSRDLPCGHKCNRKCGLCFKDVENRADPVCLLVAHVVVIRNAVTESILRCYEECDVGYCNYPCTQKLPCGHRCMGMCGESCPSLCGFCDRQSYMELLEKYIGTRRLFMSLPRIIEIEECRHLFPVEASFSAFLGSDHFKHYLDKYVDASRRMSSSMLCPFPNCGQLITQVQRYARVIKRQTLKQYYRVSGQYLKTPTSMDITSIQTFADTVKGECDSYMVFYYQVRRQISVGPALYLVFFFRNA